MRSLLLICAGLLVISGIVSANLWLELRSERQLMISMRTQLIDARATSRMPAPPPVVMAAPTPVIAAAAPASAPAECKPTGPSAAQVAAMENRVIQAQDTNVSERDLLKDPEYRRLRLAQRRLDMQRSNPGVAEALGLSQTDADKFLDLLAEYQLRSNELPAANAVNASDARAASAEMTRNRQALQRQQDEALVALLGTSGYTQWQEYQTTRGARTQAVSMGSQLLQMGLPLTSAQLKPLTTALIAEQQRQRLESPPAVVNAGQMDPQARAAAQEQTRLRAEESNRRVLAAVTTSLTPQQLAVFREQFETQAAASSAAARARERALASRRAQ
jgi:hypothetical protein